MYEIYLRRTGEKRIKKKDGWFVEKTKNYHCMF